DPSLVAYRINSGGGDISTSIGVFNADAYHSGGNVANKYSAAIAGTTDDLLYQTERYASSKNGTIQYSLPVSSGQYTVVLHFAEFHWTAAGQRVFDVSIEGLKVLDNFDIVAKAGANTATSEIITATVADGVLNILLNGAAAEGGVDRPKISGLEVLPVSGGNQLPVANAGLDKQISLPTNSVVLDGSGTDNDGSITAYSWSQASGPSTATISNASVASPTVSNLQVGTYVFSLTVTDDGGATSSPNQVNVVVNPDPSLVAYRINSGGGDISTSIGVFNADAYHSGGNVANKYSAAIAGTTDDLLYQTERYASSKNGTIQYSLPVSSGQYTVVLHFAEFHWTAAGQRVFDVSIEGLKVLDNFDIVAKAGANTATSEIITATVADGVLNILLNGAAAEGGVDRPKISGLEVLPASGSDQLSVAKVGDENVAAKYAAAETSGFATNEIVVYPNPFNDIINVVIPSGESVEYVVRLYNALGKEFYKQRFRRESQEQSVHEIDLRNSLELKSGLYFISIENTSTTDRKVVKVLKE
uniref:malectin domain-containing carbohydrate-binding protein n=1 Tax=Cesiribacter sp. SM1 TaxID=2861196 RepID=UPI001CD62DB8